MWWAQCSRCSTRARRTSAWRPTTSSSRFRNDLYDGYKTGDGIEEELHSQFGLLEDALRAAGVAVWAMVEHEADDGLATAATIAADDERVRRVFICTPDKDLTQCVQGTRVVQLDRRKGAILDAKGVEAKFGVPPTSIADYLALVGDTADGFPGLAGWGAKSAATVLARYGHIEAIPGDAADWDVKVRGAAKLAATLQTEMEDALLFRRIATVVTDCPDVGPVDSWQWRGPDDDFEELCDEAAEHSFMSVCVNPTWVALAAKRLSGTAVAVCTVIGFPLGANRPEIKAEEARRAQDDGATELDMVINVGRLKSSEDDAVRDDIATVVGARRPGSLVKVIIETCFLTDEEKRRASRLAKAAGADFVKTSTGFGTGGATAADIALMRAEVGSALGVKASGGVGGYDDLVTMVRAGATRIGASAGVKIIGEARS